MYLRLFNNLNTTLLIENLHVLVWKILSLPHIQCVVLICKLTSILAPVVQKPDNFIHWVSQYPAQPKHSVWYFWQDFCRGHWLNKILFYFHSVWDSYGYINFFLHTMMYCIYWIAAYQLDNAICPLNNWGLNLNQWCYGRGLLILIPCYLRPGFGMGGIHAYCGWPIFGEIVPMPSQF